MFQENGQTDFQSYREMIPKEIRNKTITDVIITTYSLDGALADDLLFAIYGYGEKMKDVINGKTSCRIFYHSKHSTGHFDSLCQQYPCDGRKLHSKIILIRYEDSEGKPADSKGKPAYFIVVSSMNLAYSNFIDTYFSAYGKKNEDGENDNGAVIGEFLKDDLQYDKLTEELRSVHFETGNKDIQDIQDIEFLTAEGVAEKLKNLKATELIVVSPFININAFDNPDKKNTEIHIYSTQASIDRLSASEGFTYHVLNKPKNNSQEDTEKNRTENHSEGSELKNKEIHAKILCWKDDDKTHFILGSSNATKNGYHNNIEFNVYFTPPGEYYKKYTDVLNGMFKDTEPATEKTVANDDVSNESDFEDLFEEIFRILKKSRNEIRMQYDHNNENSLYTCEINNLLLIKLPLSKTPSASVKINGKDLIEIFKNGCKLEGEKRFDDLRIEITIGNDSKSRFYYIGDLWQMDNIIKEEEWQYVKKACNELTDKIVFGKRKRKTDRQTENTREANAKKSNPPKLDSYEKLLSFCSKNSIKDEALKKKLQELKDEARKEKLQELKDEALKKKLQELKDSGINYFKELYNSFYGEMKENDHEQ